MNFDRVAPHYRWLETLAFRNQLQEARTTFVREIHPPRRVLVVGEGNGRFLVEFVRVHPAAVVDCIEASGRMIELARRRVGMAKVRFVQGDIREVELRPNSYDLLVTHFFLDCFGDESLPGVIAKLASSANQNAEWLVADFLQPARDWWHLRPRFVIALMYFFFRVVSGIEARCLLDYRPFLQTEGFRPAETILSPNKMVRSELWRRALSPG